MPLKGKDIVLGVTGGIAAYKSAEIVSRLKKAGAEVFVIMTKNASEFITPLTFVTLSGQPVVTDTFVRPEKWEVEHIALAKRAAMFLVAPATANILAKMAHGIADDMLTTTYLATKAPVLVAPAMNTGMWTAPVTQENLQKLLSRGVRQIGPGAGMLACGDVGAGRMAEPAEIVDEVIRILSTEKKRDLEGLKIIVTAGPTRERIDPVRYMTNDSSGKMGYAIAKAACRRGAKVTLVTGPVALAPPDGIRTVTIESTQDLLDTLTHEASLCDILIQAAAPADFTVSQSREKIKKTAGEPLVIRFEQTPDVAKAVGSHKRPDQVFIGFAAETQNLTENAKKKLASKKLDMIVANDVTQPGAGFSGDTNIAALIGADFVKQRPLEQKSALAEAILDEAAALLFQKRSHV